jgi:hypothetical protein
MIVDCHTLVWSERARFGPQSGSLRLQADSAHEQRHLAAIDPVDRAIVLGFKSNYLETEIPNEFVADYVRRNPEKLIGFAGIDPTEDAALDSLAEAQDHLRLKGVTLSPGLQDFHPADTRVQELYAAIERRNMPLLIEQNHRSPAAKMEFSRPILLDEVARDFPNLVIVIAHLGYPWVDETLVLLGKHRNVYADVSGLLRSPWLTYSALVSAHEYGVMDKLLFGSDFPFRSPTAAIEALYSVNQLSIGTNLVSIPREKLRQIVERDALGVMRIEAPRQRVLRAASARVDEE